MEVNTKERTLLFFLLFVFFLTLFRFLPGFSIDLEYFIRWAVNIHKNGLGATYTSPDNNYLPVFQYILYIYAKLAGDEGQITHYIRLLRLFTLVFELLGIWYIYKWINKKTAFMLLVFICILNIAYSFNTIIWGQVDGIYSSLVFIALYYAYKRDMFWSSIWMVLALNAKLQAVIFIPLWLLMCLNNLVDKKSIKAFVVPLITFSVAQLLMLLPFMLKDGQLQNLWNHIVNSDNMYPKISMAAYNFWFIILRADTVNNVPDSNIFIFGFSYKHAGLLMFCLASLLALLPVLRDVYFTLKRKQNAMVNRQRIWLSAALVSLAFFLFNTEMHERYCHAVLIFLTAYAFYSRRFLIYVLFSVAYFLNLERVLSGPDTYFFHFDYFWYNERYIACLYMIVLVLMFVKLYTIKNDGGKAVEA